MAGPSVLHAHARAAALLRRNGVTPLDVRVFVAASLTLFGVSALACIVPARRATRIEPADLFRIE